MTQLATDHGATWTFCATPFAADAIAHVRKTGQPAPTFQNFICAGAPVPPTLIAEAREVLGVCLGAAWGMTDVGCVTVTDIHQPDDAATSDGRVVHWMELKVVDADDNELPRSVEGRLVSKGPSQFLGYLERQDLYDAAITSDGFFDSRLAHVFDIAARDPASSGCASTPRSVASSVCELGEIDDQTRPPCRV